MAEKKEANLKIALIKCSQELKNAYQVDLLTAKNITPTHDIVALSVRIGDIHR
jgi:hypothetical protein